MANAVAYAPPQGEADGQPAMAVKNPAFSEPSDSAAPTIELPVFNDPVEKVACSHADLRHTKVMCTVDPTCVDVVVAPLYMVLNMLVKGPLPLTEDQLKTLMRQLVLKRAWDLQLAVFPGPNPTTALYVPQDAKVPGPASALLNLIGHVFGMCNGHDHLVAGPAKPAQDIPEYWKAQTDLWMSYHILQSVAAARYVFMTFPSRRQLGGTPLMFTKTSGIDGGQERSVRASSMRVTPSGSYLAGMFGNVLTTGTPGYDDCGYALHEELLYPSKVGQFVSSYERSAAPNLSG